MKGSQLNDRRWDILNTLEKQLEEVMSSLRSAKNDYHRFDEYDEYRNDYYIEFVKKGLDAEMALAKVTEFLNE